MLLDAKSCESSNHAAYVQACTTTNPAELQNLCYHSCRFVRSRAVARLSDRKRFPERIFADRHPSVLLTLLMRKDRRVQDVAAIYRYICERNLADMHGEHDTRYDEVLRLVTRIVTARNTAVQPALSLEADTKIALLMLRSGTVTESGLASYRKHHNAWVRRFAKLVTLFRKIRKLVSL